MNFTNIKIQWKLASLCAAFLVPIIFISYLFVETTQKDVSFARKELIGSAYFAAVKAELNAVVDLAWGSVSAADVAARQADVVKMDRSLGAGMAIAEPAGKAADAVRAAAQLPATRSLSDFDAAFDALTDHIARLEDASNLTLDPDLDSFYVQDMLTVKLPALAISGVHLFDAAAAMVTSTNQTPEMKVLFLTRKGELDGLVTGIEGDLASAERGNPDDSLRPALAGAYAVFQSAAADYAKTVASISDESTRKPTIESLRAAEQKLQQATRSLSDLSGQALDDLLAKRIHRLNSKMYVSLAITLGILAATFALAWSIARSIANPLLDLGRTMNSMAAGSLDIEILAAQRSDEIGDMAQSLEEFRKNLQKVKLLERERQEMQARAKDKQKEVLNSMADRFEVSSGVMVQNVHGAATDLQKTASAMGDLMEESAKRTGTVDSASRQAEQNVSTVAAATEELAASISEISRLVQQSTTQAGDAMQRATKSAETIKGLAETAEKIGGVVQLITDIASQTNLLALNATIEAARAGDAGKGFAVVANEVKSLATATARATGEITAQIAAVQLESQTAVETTEGIVRAVNAIHEVATAVAAAVEEQDAATREIANSVQHAAGSTADVSENVKRLIDIASKTGQSAKELVVSAHIVAGLSTELDEKVKEFGEFVRGDQGE